MKIEQCCLDPRLTDEEAVCLIREARPRRLIVPSHKLKREAGAAPSSDPSSSPPSLSTSGTPLTTTPTTTTPTITTRAITTPSTALSPETALSPASMVTNGDCGSVVVLEHLEPISLPITTQFVDAYMTPALARAVTPVAVGTPGDDLSMAHVRARLCRKDNAYTLDTVDEAADASIAPARLLWGTCEKGVLLAKLREYGLDGVFTAEPSSDDHYLLPGVTGVLTVAPLQASILFSPCETVIKTDDEKSRALLQGAITNVLTLL